MPEPEIPAAAQVVEFVRRQIEARRIKPGDRLPPERDLAQEIGVSRPSLRSGLQTLQALGVIQSRQGAGRREGERTTHEPGGIAAACFAKASR